MLRLRLSRQLLPGILLTTVLGAALVGCTSIVDVVDAAPTATSYDQYDAMHADWANAYVECVRRAGADAQLTDDGSIRNATVPGRQTEEGLDAGCVEEVGHPPDVPAPTDAFMKGLYELLVDQAECLRAHGYTISEPPSRDEWVENYDGYSWNPLLDVNSAGLDVQEADHVCPQPQPREAERLGATL